MSVTVLVVFLVFTAHAGAARGAGFYDSFECRNSKCNKINIVNNTEQFENDVHSSLASCRLVCNPYAALWPVPTELLKLSKSYVQVNPENFYIELSNMPKAARPFMSTATEIFINNMWLLCGTDCSPTNFSLSVHVTLEDPTLDLTWETSEIYNLDMKLKGTKITINITSDTVFGARHAFETLLQLMAPVRTPDDSKGLVLLEEASIIDKPKFPHRGLLIDTARNFLPKADILRTIDGLSSVKMNVLHWHATDSQSFPIEIKNIPSMTQYGAYSPDQVYSIQDMKDIIAYGNERGVRVILELDTPSHAGAGWEWGETEGLGKLAVCVNRQPWREFCIQPPCGQLNPINPNTYTVLESIYDSILDVWDRNSVLHLGGDELFVNCWNSTPEITAVMQDRGMNFNLEDFLNLWSSFHSEQLNSIDRLRGHEDSDAILWSSHLTTPENIERYLNKSRFVIQTWVEDTSELNEQLLDLGYRLIISTKNAWYLDHGFWGRTNYHNWKDVYKNRIPRKKGVLGGEVCMWGEYVSSDSLDSRIWPRTCAAAERLWSDSFESISEVEPRFQAHRERLQYRNIHPDAIVPEWCNQHDGQCT